MKKGFFLLLLVCVSSVCSAPTQGEWLHGAWLEERVKWMKVRPDINPHLQWAQATILYFQNEQKFGVIDCTVNREPAKYMTISHGDPRRVNKGEWRINDDTISITYKLMEATVLPIGQKLPGPTKNRVIKVSRERLLRFEGKTFRRAPALDKSAAEALYGVQTSPPSQKKGEKKNRGPSSFLNQGSKNMSKNLDLTPLPSADRRALARSGVRE